MVLRVWVVDASKADLWFRGVNDQRVVALHASAKNDDLDNVRRCLNEGLDVDAPGTSGITTLVVAAEHGHREVAQRSWTRERESIRLMHRSVCSPFSWPRRRVTARS